VVCRALGLSTCRQLSNEPVWRHDLTSCVPVVIAMPLGWRTVGTTATRVYWWSSTFHAHIPYITAKERLRRWPVLSYRCPIAGEESEGLPLTNCVGKKGTYIVYTWNEFHLGASYTGRSSSLTLQSSTKYLL